MATSQQSHEDSPLGTGWTRQKLMELVETYKNRPCLYDNTSPGYHNREERSRSWIEIANRMGREEDDIRAKMKSIRTQYARIIQKGQHPKCKMGHTVSSWWLLPTLSFLDDFIIPRKADSDSIKDNEIVESSQVSQVRDVGRIYQDDSIVENGEVSDMIYENMPPETDFTHPPTNSVSNAGQVVELDDHSSNHQESSPYQSPFTTPRISPISISHPSISQYRNSRLKTRRPLKKLKKDHIAVSTASAPSPFKSLNATGDITNNMLLKTVLTFAERTNRDDDEDAIFGRYVGNEMRSVTDLQAKRIAKMRIQKVLFEAQTGWTETSNEGVYHAPRDGTISQDNFPVGVVCNTNNSRV